MKCFHVLRELQGGPVQSLCGVLPKFRSTHSVVLYSTGERIDAVYTSISEPVYNFEHSEARFLDNLELGGDGTWSLF